jgi:HlyD family secretion protein
VKIGDDLFTIDLSALEDELVQLKLNREIQALQIEKTKEVSVTSSSSGAKIGVELAKLNLLSAQNYYDNQVLNLEKNQELYNEGIISQNELDTLTKAVEDAFSQVEVADLNLQGSESDLNQVYSSNSASSKSIEFDVQIQLKNLESLDLNIAKIENQLRDMNAITKATLDGVITAMNMKIGDSLLPGAPLLEIMDMENIIIKANVREYDIKDLKLGQSVLITGDAISKKEELLGELSSIAPLAKDVLINGRQTKGIEIEIRVIKGKEVLKPGYTTDCEITTFSKEDVVIAGYDLFRDDVDNNKSVFVVVNGVLEERRIEIGIISDFDSEVLSGLEVGELVVVNPSLALKEGLKVSVEKNLTEKDSTKKDSTEKEGE